MSILIFLTSMLSLVLYLYGIGLRYLGILPILFFVGTFFYYSTNQVLEIKDSSFFQKNSLLIVWIVVLGGLIGTLITLGVDIGSTRRIIIIVNFLSRIGSYFFDYEDGKNIFQGGLYFTLISFLGYTAIKSDSIANFIKICSSVGFLTTIMLGTISIIIGTKNKTEDFLYYKLILSGLISLMLFITNTIPNPYISIIISLFIITIILGFFYHNKSKKVAIIRPSQEISLRRILAGERISGQKKIQENNTNEKLNLFLNNTPSFFKNGIEIINIAILIFFISQYITSGISYIEYLNQIFYRSIFLLIITNILLLKRIKYNSLVQNLIFFILINFSIYISLFSIFKGNIGEIVTRGIMRNMLSTLLMFYIHKLSFFSKIINKLDYYYRIICALLGMLANLVLLIKTSLAGELIFFLFLLYLGIQGMILFYVTKFVNKLEFEENTTL